MSVSSGSRPPMGDATVRQAPEPKAISGLSPLLPVQEALATVRRIVVPHLRAESAPLRQSVGRILAIDLHADMDQPAFDRSMMDGIAVRADDCAVAGSVLRGAGASPAGSPYPHTVQAGTFVRVMTGGVVPLGADSVVPVERITRLDGDPGDPATGSWRVEQPVRPGQHVAKVGSEVRKGDRLLPAGTYLGAAQLGALAAFGHATIEVSVQPVVTLVPTGSEIVPIEMQPAVGQVRDSNTYVLAALFDRFGCQTTVAKTVIDDAQQLAESLLRAAANSDLLVTCGGVSMGDYDLVVSVLKRLGAEVHFHRVRLKPGKPVLFASLNGTPVLGLPGNPVSATVGALLFGRTAVSRLLAASRQQWLEISAISAVAQAATYAREEVRPGRWTQWQGRAAVARVATAGSADLAHFAGGEVLIHRPAHAAAVDAGDDVSVWLWPQAH